MSLFFLTLDATSVYGSNPPILEILVDGAVVSSFAIDSSYSATTYKITYSGSVPSSFSLRFNDGFAEGGRSITLNSVLISGQTATNEFSLLSLNQNDSADLNVASTDYLFGRVTPTVAEMGTPTIEGTVENETIIGTTGDDVIRGFDGNDKIVAGDGDDRIIGDGGLDDLRGGNGHDYIYSGTGNDRVLGGNGDDIINSHNDNDRVYGEDGRDTINLGKGNDRGYGGDDDDILYGGNGNDFMSGDDGDDYLEGQGGNDRVYGGEGNDVLYGNNGFDVIYGNNGDDEIYGGGQADKIYGGNDNDYVNGGSGADYIYGEAGNDDLRGGGDRDHIWGGAGADLINGGGGDDILFYDFEDEFWGGSGFDWIVLQRTDGSDIDFGDARFRTNIEGFTMINWQDGARANELTVDINDILSNTSADELFVAGDVGLDSVVSADFDVSDRVLGAYDTRGGHTYALFNEGGADLYVKLGLTLNGVTVT